MKSRQVLPCEFFACARRSCCFPFWLPVVLPNPEIGRLGKNLICRPPPCQGLSSRPHLAVSHRGKNLAAGHHRAGTIRSGRCAAPSAGRRFPVRRRTALSRRPTGGLRQRGHRSAIVPASRITGTDSLQPSAFFILPSPRWPCRRQWPGAGTCPGKSSRKIILPLRSRSGRGEGPRVG